MKTLSILGWKLSKLCFVLFFFMTPYIAIAFDRIAFFERGYIASGGEMLIPLPCFVVLYVLLQLEEYFKEQVYESKTKRQTLL